MSNNHSKTLRSNKPHVVFQECPGEVSLCFSFYGCPLRCSGCHSEELWDTQGGSPLSVKAFTEYLIQYQGLITAVVFFGGEWSAYELQKLLKAARKFGLKTCLYTGLNHVSRHLRPFLNFAKVGPWQEAQGGLNTPNSNQRFYQIQHGQLCEDLSHLFYDQQHTQKEPYHAAA